MNDIHVDPQRLARAGDIKRLNNRQAAHRPARPAGWTYLLIGFALGVGTVLLLAALI